MNNKNLLAAISVSTLLISSPFILSSSPILSQTISNSLQNSLFAEAQYDPTPIANDDSATTNVDTPVNIDVLDNDDLNGTLGPLSLDDCILITWLHGFGITASADVVTPPSNGNVVITGSVPNQTFTYTPDPGYTGSDSFTYQMCDTDSFEYSNIATVNITVNAIEPIANDDSVATDFETPIEIDVLDNDDLNGGVGPLSLDDNDCSSGPSGFNIFGGIAAYADVTSPPSNGSITLNGTVPNHTFTYTPDSGFSGVDSFTYRNCDSTSNEFSGSATVTINVQEEVITLSPTIDIFKDKADGTVQLNDQVKIQIDVTNPNSFDLTDLTVNSTVDGSKVNIIEGSVNEDQISGPKFNFFSLNTYAQAFSSTINGNTVSIDIPVLGAGQTRSFVFDVNALDSGVGDINSQIVQNGSVVSTDDTQIPITQPPTPTGLTLIRTGGSQHYWALLGLFSLFGLAVTELILTMKNKLK